jgi:hypothetical protein
MTTIAMEKIEGLTLRAGGGTLTDKALCVMQAVDYVTSGGTSDHPECASPVITKFLTRWNDSLPSDDDRARLLRPLIADVVGTRTTDADEMTRSWLAYDWMVRVQMATWLRLAPSLVPHADAVEALAPITSRETLDAAWPTIASARDASARDASHAAWAAAGDAARAAARAAAWAAARDAAWDAAGAAARAAARDAAWAAAGAAAWDAAGAAAWDAAWDAARAAARAAAGDALAKAVAALQLSAQQLVRDMCEVGK